MRRHKQSLKQTLQLIIDILNFESPDINLKHQLSNTATDWDQLVVVASQHLVLPAVYCRLQQKSLLNVLPEDLVAYLKELTQLNRERNDTLMSEVQKISELLQSNHIQHVFIKGAALLAGNYYKDNGERMIGDIDILVASKDLDNAFNLLVSEGYDQFVAFNYDVKNYRHRPRQISRTKLGAIELHDQLLKHHYNHLINKEAFLSKAQIVNGVYLPSSEHLVLNTILAHQINDRCYDYNILKLKSVYDVFVLGLTHNNTRIEQLSNSKYSLGFLNLLSVHCPSISPALQTFPDLLRKRTYLFSLDFPMIGKQILKLKSTYIIVNERIKLILYNKSYRTHVIKNMLN